MQKPYLSIKDAYCYEIRTVQEADMEKIRSARNDQIDVLRQSKPISQEDQKKYYQNVVLKNQESDTPEMILFSLFKDDIWIGYGGLVHINYEHRRAEISFLVDTVRSKDLKTYREDFLHFLNLTIGYAFQELELHRIHGETYAFRKDHVKILEEFGFKLEGLMKEHIFIGKTPHDALLHGLLKKDFKPMVFV